MIDRKTAVAPAQHPVTKLIGDGALPDQKIEHRPPKTALERLFRDRRRCDECAVTIEHPVGSENVRMRMKVHQIAEELGNARKFRLGRTTSAGVQ